MASLPTNQSRDVTANIPIGKKKKKKKVKDDYSENVESAKVGKISQFFRILLPFCLYERYRFKIINLFGDRQQVAMIRYFTLTGLCSRSEEALANLFDNGCCCYATHICFNFKEGDKTIK